MKFLIEHQEKLLAYRETLLIYAIPNLEIIISEQNTEGISYKE